MSFEQILEGAQQQSLSDLRQLVLRVAQHYPTHAQRILDAVIANLSIPTDVEGFEPTEIQLTAVLNAILCLTEVAQFYSRTETSVNLPVGPAVLISTNLAEKYLFWTLRLLGVPASLTSPNPALQDVSSQLRLSLYQHATFFLRRLFKVPAVSYQAFPSHLKSTVLDVVIAVWVSFPNAEPPIYAAGHRGQLEPGLPSLDPSTEFVCGFVEKEGKAMAGAVMDGRLCSPEVFVQRTVARMRALSQLKNLQHLSHLPPTTAESINIGLMVSATSRLSQGDQRLRRVLVNEGTTGAYVGMLSELAERMETTSNGEIVEWSVPNNLPQWFDLVNSFIDASNLIVHGATRSPVAILREVESLVSNGVVRILAVAKRHRPQERKTRWDTIWDGISMYAFYLEVLPGLYKDAMGHLDPTLPDGFAKRVYPRDPSSVYQRPQEGEPTNPRDVCVSVDISCLEIMTQFVDKKHRVRLCDNLNHYSRLGTYEESKTQDEHMCSRCHTVVYCSTECQQEDWRAFHRKECAQMAKDYAEAKNADQIYSYENRTFQTTAVRYAFESLMPNQDRLRGAIPYGEGRNGVMVPDLFRPVAGFVIRPSNYLDRVLQSVPVHIRPRLSEYLRIFVDTNGTYVGADPTRVKAQNRRLLAKAFRFGDKDVNVLILLHRVHYFEFRGRNNSETINKCIDYKSRGPEARSDYLVQGVMTFMSPPSNWTNKMDLDDVLDGVLPN